MHRSTNTLGLRPASLLALLLLAALPACSTTASAARSAAVGPYEVEILVDGSSRTVYQHRGRYYVAGAQGQRYEIRVYNHTGRRVEAVVTVDGRDVIDGRPGTLSKRGYLLEAGSSVTIDGFRTSSTQVAAFRFSPVAASYAARMGDAANVGVIGVALFPERVWRQPVVVAPPPPSPVDPRYYAPGYGGGGLGTAMQEDAPAAAADAALGGQSEAKSSASFRRPGPPERPGLGTAFGERRYSAVQEVSFERQDPERPAAVVQVRYNDWNGLVAAGVVPPPRPRLSEQQRREQANPFPADGPFATPPPGW